MGIHIWALIGWFAFLAIAWPYARNAKHPKTRPVAAYLIFVTVFSIVAAAAFALIVLIAAMAGPGSIDGLGAALIVTLLAFVPAFSAARHMIRRPPRQEPSPP